jgi:hypothetical protein
MEERSAHRIVQSVIDLKSWIEAAPDVDQVRPARCLCCNAPSRPVGGCLGLHGHGLRDRSILGALTPSAEVQWFTVRVRRYRCTACEAIVTVVPRGVLRRRLYSASAIGWVLARVGLDGVTTAQVRAELSPSRVVGVAAVDRWIAASRWIEASREGRLFSRLGPHAAGSSCRQVAERTVMQLIALAPPCGGDASLAHAAWRGAALAA